MSERDRRAIADARKYLETGGFGETLALAEAAWAARAPKVQMDTSMAIALLEWVGELSGQLKRRADA